MQLRALPHDVTLKSDGSPVSRADLEAHALICERLRALAPAITIVSEEQAHPAAPADGSAFWLIDPIDGTKSFLRGEDEFTVNIACIENGTPTLGVIVVPAMQQLYGGGTGLGAFRSLSGGAREPIACRPPAKDGALDVIVSHSKARADAAQLLGASAIKSRTQAASSLKFCRIAEGLFDVYPRFGPTMQWDTAAGQAIVEAAGGRVVHLQSGQPLHYGGTDLRNPPFAAWGLRA